MFLSLGRWPSQITSGRTSLSYVSTTLLQGGTLFWAAAGFTSLAGLGFHVLASRALGPDAYASLAAVLGLLLLSAVPLAALELTVAAAAARLTARRLPDLRRLGRRVAGAAALVSVAAAAASPIVVSYLHLPSPAAVLLMALYLGLAALAATLRGVLLGSLRYGQAAGSILTLGAVKLVLGVVLVARGGDLTAAMGALVVAELAHLAMLAWWARDGFILRTVAPSLGFHRFLSPLPMLAVVGLWVLGTGDVIMARQAFDGPSGGMYAAAGTAAHMLLFVPQMVLQVAFPLLARSRGEELRRRFWWTAGLVVGVCTLGSALLGLLPGPVVRVLFGAGFEGAVPLLRLLAPATTAVAFVFVVVHLHVAAGHRAAGVAWLGVVAVGAVAALGPPSPLELARWMTTVSAVSAVVAATTVRWAWRTDPHRSSRESGHGRPQLTVAVPFSNPGFPIARTIQETPALCRKSVASSNRSAGT